MDLSKVLLRNSSSDNKSPVLLEALYLIKKGELERGKLRLNEAGKNGESNAYIILGSIHEHLEDSEEALKNFSKALNQVNSAALFHLGQFYLKRHDYAQADFYLKEASSQGIQQSYVLLSYLETKKDWDYLWFVLFGPLFLIKRGNYKESFWSILLMVIVALMWIKSASIITLISTFFFINLIFSDSYYKSLS